MSEDSVYQALRGSLGYLRLAAAAEALPAELDYAQKNKLGHSAFLHRLLEVEVAATELRRRAGLERFASLPSPWRLSDFDFSAQPSVDKKLVDELIPSQISVTGVQRVLQTLLGERVSIRDLPAILEGIAEADVNHNRAGSEGDLAGGARVPSGGIAGGARSDESPVSMRAGGAFYEPSPECSGTGAEEKSAAERIVAKPKPNGRAHDGFAGLGGAAWQG